MRLSECVSRIGSRCASQTGARTWSVFQTRTRVLDDTLRAKFQSWYPGLFDGRPQVAQNIHELLDLTDFDASQMSNETNGEKTAMYAT